MIKAIPTDNHNHNRELINQSIKLLEEMNLPWIHQDNGKMMRLEVSDEKMTKIVGALTVAGLDIGREGIEADFCVMRNGAPGASNDGRKNVILLREKGIEKLDDEGYQFTSQDVSKVNGADKATVGQGINS